MTTKRIFTTILSGLVLGIAGAWAGQAVPYTSELYVNYNLDEGWKTANDSRGASGWGRDSDSSTDDFNAAGVRSGAVKPYDSSHAANCWLISPAIDVTAGTQYTVGIWLRTHHSTSSETENFRITVASEATSAAQKAGTVVLDKKGYVNKGVFEHFTATFTPTESGEVYFGLNCYSDADMYALYATGFSITSDGGENPGPDVPGPDQPEDPGDKIEGIEIPCTLAFDSSDTFAQWTQATGPEGQPHDWTINTWSKFTEFCNEDVKEDNYLISPALAFETAGSYLVDVKRYIQGRLEVLIGTDPKDLTSFKRVGLIETTSFESDTDRLYFDIAEAGTYYLALHACTEVGTFMGIRVFDLKIKADVPVPALVNDLSVVPDLMDDLLVSLSWTYPSVTNSGAPLTLLDKAEIYRNGECIHTVTWPTPGQFTAWADESITEAGIYKYKVVVYNSNGCNTDAEPMEVSAGYVGRPLAQIPYDESFRYTSDDVIGQYTVVDANNDGNGWVFDSASYNPQFKSTVPDAETSMNDMIASPYFNVETGKYYSVCFTAGGMGMDYKLGVATNRHSAETFTELLSVEDDQTYTTSDHTIIYAPDEDGQVCFAILHVGTKHSESSYYNFIGFSELSVTEQAILPTAVTDLTAEAAADNSLCATMKWTNPTIDNGGKALTSISKAVILRDGQPIATITEGLIPGETAEYTDKDITEKGQHSYAVEIYNDNGKADADAMTVSVYVGPGTLLPYTATDYEDWTPLSPDGSSWDLWDTNYDGYYAYSKSWGTPNTYGVSPIFEFEPDSFYTLTIVTGSDSSADADIVAGRAIDISALEVVAELPAAGHDEDYTHKYTIATGKPGIEATDEGFKPVIGDICIPAGKNCIGFHAKELGKTVVKSFEIVKRGDVTGIQTVAAAAEGLSYNAATLHTPGATSIEVYAIDGTLIASASADSLDISSLTKGRTVIAVATINGRKAHLKIRL